MPPLAARLRAHIESNGPIPFFDFMEAALYDADEGYFAGDHDGPRAGARGDFVTSPTLTPVFSATLAAFVHDAWERMGSPKILTLGEIGGGSASLMATLLEAWYDMPGDNPAMTEVLFVERDPNQHDEARERLLAAIGEHEMILTLTTEVPDRIPGPAILICNELWDNLPCDLYATDEEGTWHERRVGLDGDSFTFIDVPMSDRGNAWKHHVAHDAPILHQVEDPRGAREWVADLANRIDGSGILVAIDYGMNALEMITEPRSTGTLTAFKGHEQSNDILGEPGTHDITYHVDFTSVGRHAEKHGWNVLGYTTQGAFLIELGLAETIAGYAAKVKDESSWAAFESAKQLMLPGGMGERFKVMVLGHGVDEASLSQTRGLGSKRPWNPERRH